MKKFLSILSAGVMSLTLTAASLPISVGAVENTTAVTQNSDSLYFDNVNGEIYTEVGGLYGDAEVRGYDLDRFYEVGESPFKWTIEDESVAVIVNVQGNIVNVKGVSPGETVITAEAPDGRKASIKIRSVMYVATTTVAMWVHNNTTTTTTAADIPLTTGGTKQLTLKDVAELSKKGNSLTWSDFADYKGTDIGSGLYILKFDLEDGYTLLVGGVPTKPPIYIDLLRCDEEGRGIDIRTEDVEAYLNSVPGTTSTVAEPVAATTATTVSEVTDKNVTMPVQTDEQGRSVDSKGGVMVIAVDGTSVVVTLNNDTTTTTTETTVSTTEDDFGFEGVNVYDGCETRETVGCTTGFMVKGLKDGETVEYSLSNEEVGRISYADNTQVSVDCLKEGRTKLTATTSLGRTFTVIISAEDYEREPVPLTQYKKGDINLDGEFSLADVIEMNRCLSNVNRSFRNESVADINSDTKVNVIDGILIKRAAIGTYEIS